MNATYNKHKHNKNNNRFANTSNPMIILEDHSSNVIEKKMSDWVKWRFDANAMIRKNCKEENTITKSYNLYITIFSKL
jgi:hypothetical protein